MFVYILTGVGLVEGRVAVGGLRVGRAGVGGEAAGTAAFNLVRGRERRLRTHTVALERKECACHLQIFVDHHLDITKN